MLTHDLVEIRNRMLHGERLGAYPVRAARFFHVWGAVCSARAVGWLRIGILMSLAAVLANMVVRLSDGGSLVNRAGANILAFAAFTAFLSFAQVALRMAMCVAFRLFGWTTNLLFRWIAVNI